MRRSVVEVLVVDRLVLVVESEVEVVLVEVVETLVLDVEIEVEVVLVEVVLVLVSHRWRRSINPSSLWNCRCKDIVSSYLRNPCCLVNRTRLPGGLSVVVVVVIGFALRTRLRGFVRSVVVVLSVDVLDEVDVLRLTVDVLEEVVVEVLVVV